AAEAEAATGGQSTAPWLATGVSLDSRSLAHGDLFVAIKGPNHDGHSFVAAAFRNGAAAAMVDRRGAVASHRAEWPLLRVDDTDAGLQALATAARQRSQARVIAVTGSVGKTSTKEALALALAAYGATSATTGNLNNAWGVPLSMARLPRHATYAVLEIGMNQPGEIAPLSRLARPHVAIITSIGAAHLEAFDSIAAIAAEKADICAGLVADGIAVLPRDSDQFAVLEARAKAQHARVLTFGRHSSADGCLVSWRKTAEGAVLEAMILGHRHTVTLPLTEEHWASNVLAVLTAVAALGLDPGPAATALGKLRSLPGRGERFTAAIRGGVLTVIDDAYNANPDSMRAALHSLGVMKPAASGRRIAVLGDMLELGDTAASLHKAMAADVTAAGVDLVFAIGPLAAVLFAALPEKNRALAVTSADALPEALDQLLRPDDIVLVKGSKASRASLVVDHFRHRATSRNTQEGVAHAV
ncbi:MAG: UDP-N-acetylmuramoyl-tripeptide--D-alanyl-D-alanine ligase, partial [Alphaproteobacteria bacterium]